MVAAAIVLAAAVVVAQQSDYCNQQGLQGNCTYSSTADELAFYNILNPVRRHFGAGDLVPNEPLRQAAMMHAAYLAVRNELTHGEAPGFFGTNIPARTERAGYSGGAGENATTAGTPQGSFDSWLTSYGHCTNMLLPRYRDSGYAIVSNGGASRAVHVLGAGASGSNSAQATAFCCMMSDVLGSAQSFAGSVRSNPSYITAGQACLQVSGTSFTFPNITGDNRAGTTQTYVMPTDLQAIIGDGNASGVTQRATAAIASTTVGSVADIDPQVAGFVRTLNTCIQQDGGTPLRLNLKLQLFTQRAGAGLSPEAIADQGRLALNWWGVVDTTENYPGDAMAFLSSNYRGWVQRFGRGQVGTIVISGGSISFIRVQSTQSGELNNGTTLYTGIENGVDSSVDCAALCSGVNPAAGSQTQTTTSTQTNNATGSTGSTTNNATGSTGSTGSTTTTTTTSSVPANMSVVQEAASAADMAQGTSTYFVVVAQNVSLKAGDVVELTQWNTTGNLQGTFQVAVGSNRVFSLRSAGERNTIPQDGTYNLFAIAVSGSGRATYSYRILRASTAAQTNTTTANTTNSTTATTTNTNTSTGQGRSATLAAGTNNYFIMVEQNVSLKAGDVVELTQWNTTGDLRGTFQVAVGSNRVFSLRSAGERNTIPQDGTYNLFVIAVAGSGQVTYDYRIISSSQTAQADTTTDTQTDTTSDTTTEQADQTTDTQTDTTSDTTTEQTEQATDAQTDTTSDTTTEQTDQTTDAQTDTTSDTTTEQSEQTDTTTGGSTEQTDQTTDTQTDTTSEQPDGSAGEQIDTSDAISQIMAAANAQRTQPLFYSQLLTELARRYKVGEDVDTLWIQYGLQPPLFIDGLFLEPDFIISSLSQNLIDPQYTAMGIYVGADGTYALVLANVSQDVEQTFVNGGAADTSTQPDTSVSTGQEDADGDGVVGDAELCPNEAGPADNSGCPVAESSELTISFPFPASMITDSPPDMLDAPNGGVITYMNTGEEVTVIGQSEDGSWYEIIDSVGNQGWVPSWGVVH